MHWALDERIARRPNQASTKSYDPRTGFIESDAGDLIIVIEFLSAPLVRSVLYDRSNRSDQSLDVDAWFQVGAAATAAGSSETHISEDPYLERVGHYKMRVTVDAGCHLVVVQTKN